jgi:hypothetical protein
MEATQAMEQSQDSQRQDSRSQNTLSQDSRNQDSKRNFTKLDERYGKIGISAVAGAIRHKGEQRKASQTRFIPRDSD